MATSSAAPAIAAADPAGDDKTARLRMKYMSGIGGSYQLAALLVVSSLLRIALVVRGGQLYWPDEERYTRVLQAWSEPTLADVFRSIIATGEYWGFALVAALPAGLHHVLSRGIDADDRVFTVPALFLSQMSVIAIGMVYAVARRSGSDTREAFVAALLMAGATTMFYYARHLLPYDTSMALVLGALWCGVGTASRFRSFACGALSAFAFLTYNGYWLLAGVVL